MKSIKEKEMLVKLAKSLGQEIDDSIVQEVTKHKKFENNIRESIRSNIFEDLSKALADLKHEADRVSVENNFPLPPSLDDLDLIIAEEKENVLVQPQAEEPPPEPSINPLAELAAEAITASAKRDSFQQPDPLLVAPDINSIQKKIRYLEQWIAKVSMAGQGSGETRFLRLDDVNKNSYAARDTHKILRYRPNNISAYDEVFFGNLSGDQGPIYSMQYDVTGYTGNANLGPGLTYYDPERDTLEILHKDGNRTYTGLDNYIRVQNNGSGGTITKGTLLQFSGVDATNVVPLAKPYINNANALPLYVIGVAANTISPNSINRAMILGELEDVDTTGSMSNETWHVGDLLWSNPSIPGTLTKVKPTAPNVVISVASVTKVGTTDGRLLVRPTIWPRLRYGDFYSIYTQSALATNQDTMATLSNTLISSGFTLSSNTIVAFDSGLYKFQVRAQLTSSSSNSKSIILWYKKNGISIPYSSIRQSIAENGGYATITNFQLISLDAGDNVSIHFAVTDTTLSIDSPTIFDGAPSIPSVQLTITEAAL